jgi:hypothetical protein
LKELLHNKVVPIRYVCTLYTKGNLQDRVMGTPLVGVNHTSSAGGLICSEEESIWTT